MDRLTTKNINTGEPCLNGEVEFIALSKDCNSLLRKAINKLSKYEDTGFTPEEQEDIKACLDVEGDGKSGEDTLKDLLELMRYRKTGLTPEEVKAQSHNLGVAYNVISSWERESKKWCDQLFVIRKWLSESGYDMDDILR